MPTSFEKLLWEIIEMCQNFQSHTFGNATYGEIPGAPATQQPWPEWLMIRDDGNCSATTSQGPQVTHPCAI